jgi:hypothetical protein
MAVGSGGWLGLTPDPRFTELFRPNACVGIKAAANDELPITRFESGYLGRFTELQRLFLGCISFLVFANFSPAAPLLQRRSAMRPLHFDGRSMRLTPPKPRIGNHSPRLQLELPLRYASPWFAPNVTDEPRCWLARLVRQHEA